jgi:hypothetical protein
MKIYWCVKKERRWCVFEDFASAWYDWKSHEGEVRFIFPRIMTKKRFETLRDFDGW